MTVSKWFIIPHLRPEAKLRLFCLPFAGGSPATYRQWPLGLPETVEIWAVQPPGRGSRIKEPAYERLTPLVADLADAMAPHLNFPYAIFGHSLGGLLGFELSRLIQQRQAPGPLWLGISAVRAPHLPDPNPTLHLTSDLELVEALKSYGGTPEGLLDDPEMRALLLPIIRRDFAVFETYDFQPGPVLGTPIAVFGGLEDIRVPDQDSLEAWSLYTNKNFQSYYFPGGHFYLQSHQADLVASVKKQLETVLQELSRI